VDLSDLNLASPRFKLTGRAARPAPSWGRYAPAAGTAEVLAWLWASDCNIIPI
jgi:hypothetical protein